MLNQIITHCEALASSVTDGHADALKVYAELRAIQAAASDALKAIDEATMTEATKHGKTFTAHGLQWTVSEGRRAFRYDHIEAWAITKGKLEAIEKRAKDAALANEKGLGMHTTDGEVIDAAKVVYGKPFIAIKPLPDERT